MDELRKLDGGPPPPGCPWDVLVRWWVWRCKLLGLATQGQAVGLSDTNLPELCDRHGVLVSLSLSISHGVVFADEQASQMIIPLSRPARVLAWLLSYELSVSRG